MISWPVVKRDMRAQNSPLCSLPYGNLPYGSAILPQGFPVFGASRNAPRFCVNLRSRSAGKLTPATPPIASLIALVECLQRWPIVPNAG